MCSGYTYGEIEPLPFIVQIWVSEVKLSTEGQAEITISAHAWVNTLNSPRVFFESTGSLPSNTPTGLTQLRQRELHTIQARGCPMRCSITPNSGL